MKKKILAMMLFVALSVSMVACGSANSDSESGVGDTNKKEFSAEELAQSLITQITYTEELEQIPADKIDWYVTLEEGVTGILYMASGVSSEEVAVFTAPDEATAKTMIANVEELLADQEDQNAAYDAKVAQRIENAVLEQKGCYVILCVSDDSAKAKELVKEAFGE